MPLPLGKLPAPVLADLLSRIPTNLPGVLSGSLPGTDAAVLTLGDRLLVATTDPITFVADRLGWYAVQVNANDIAVMGATPRWMLATLLLPADAGPDLPAIILDDMLAACAEHGIALAGGHTEVTAGIDRPIAIATMLGECGPDQIVLPGRTRPGDRILITKGIAIEGTAVLAGMSSMADVPAEVIASATRLLEQPGISVVRDARILCAAVRPRAMHDATEGGLATALRELAGVSQVGLRVIHEHIPILPETAALCAALDLDPLGLLASGCLIAVVAPEDEPAALAALHQAGITATAIGDIEPAAAGFVMTTGEHNAPLPEFARDELARYIESMQRSEE